MPGDGPSDFPPDRHSSRGRRHPTARYRESLTPSEVFWNRRQIVQRLGLAGLSLAIGSCGEADRRSQVDPLGAASPTRHPSLDPGGTLSNRLPSGLESHQVTDQQLVAQHNNFYEFLPGRGGDVAPLTKDFNTSPWSLDVQGACERPRSFSLDDLLAFPHEERLYHFRCVERWAMNVPWVGFPLRQLLEVVQPSPEVRWVAFVSASDPASMPGIAATPYYPWPYHEALRLDEALHDLTLLATGVFGTSLPKQHGAPVRLVVPWKYGYKSAKSLVAIQLLEQPPSTFWHKFSPHEYGMLSNVNPNVPHPRWNQYHSWWLRDDPTWPNGDDIFPTEMFNGYDDEVGSMYPNEPRTRQRPLEVGEVAR